MTSGTLWLSVVKGEGTGSAEKERGAADTLERAKDTVHATDGGIKQQHDKGGRTGKDTAAGRHTTHTTTSHSIIAYLMITVTIPMLANEKGSRTTDTNHAPLTP